MRQDSASHKYLLGSHLIQLGEAATRHFASFAHPYLAEMMEVSGETANLAVFENGHVAYVAQVPSRHHRVRMFTEVAGGSCPTPAASGRWCSPSAPGPSWRPCWPGAGCHSASQGPSPTRPEC